MDETTAAVTSSDKTASMTVDGVLSHEPTVKKTTTSATNPTATTEPEVTLSPTAKPAAEIKTAAPPRKEPMASDVDRLRLSGDEKIPLNAQELETVGLIFKHRLDGITDVDKGSTALRDFDRVVSALGPKAMERFKANTFTEGDVALALTLISELRTLTEMATGKTAEEGKTFWRRLPKLVVKDASGATTTLFAHSEALGERTDQKAQEKYLRELSGLELTIGKKYFGKDFSTTFFPLIGPDSKMGQHAFKDKIFVYLREDLKRQFPNQTSEQILTDNREAFNKALVEAHHKAFMDYGEEHIKRILEKPAGEVGSDILEKRAVELETPENPKTPEELAELRKKVADAKVEFVAADVEFKKFTNEEESLVGNIKEQNATITRITDELADGGRLKGEIKRVLDSIEAYKNDLPKHISTPIKKGIDSSAQIAEQLQKTIFEYENRLKSLYEKEELLSKEKREAKKNHDEFKVKKNRMDSDVYREAERKIAEDARNLKGDALKKALDNLQKATKDEGKEPTDDAKETAKEIRDIKRARDANFEGRISEILFAKGTATNPAAENKYSRLHLASTEEIGEAGSTQIDGAERIRELGFGTEDPQYYQKHADRFRKVWSDEAIAKAIIWIYEIKDAGTLGLSGTDLLKKVLPVINQNSRFKAYDLMRFLIGESVRAAAIGEPHLKISGDYIPKPPIETAPETPIPETPVDTPVRDARSFPNPDTPPTTTEEYQFLVDRNHNLGLPYLGPKPQEVLDAEKAAAAQADTTASVEQPRDDLDLARQKAAAGSGDSSASTEQVLDTVGAHAAAAAEEPAIELREPLVGADDDTVEYSSGAIAAESAGESAPLNDPDRPTIHQTEDKPTIYPSNNPGILNRLNPFSRRNKPSGGGTS